MKPTEKMDIMFQHKINPGDEKIILSDFDVFASLSHVITARN